MVISILLEPPDGGFRARGTDPQGLTAQVVVAHLTLASGYIRLARNDGLP
jgi:hypothetical protein